jgi:hypothetical protein
MKKELDEQLCKKYPKIFRDRHANMQVTCMCWGFECGDGWYNILDQLCERIQGHIDSSRNDRARALKYNRKLERAIRNNKVEEFLRDEFKFLKPEFIEKKIIESSNTPPAFRDVPEKLYQVVAVQVKEKFGTLRFYTNHEDDYISGLISMACSMSSVTCEVCGNPGKSNDDGWIYTRCKDHEQN